MATSLKDRHRLVPTDENEEVDENAKYEVERQIKGNNTVARRGSWPTYLLTRKAPIWKKHVSSCQ